MLVHVVNEPFGQEYKVEIVLLLSYHSLRTRQTSWIWGLEVTELPNVKTVPIVAESIQQTFSVHKSNIIRQHSICIPSENWGQHPN